MSNSKADQKRDFEACCRSLSEFVEACAEQVCEDSPAQQTIQRNLGTFRDNVGDIFVAHCDLLLRQLLVSLRTTQRDPRKIDAMMGHLVVLRLCEDDSLVSPFTHNVLSSFMSARRFALLVTDDVDDLEAGLDEGSCEVWHSMDADTRLLIRLSLCLKHTARDWQTVRATAVPPGRLRLLHFPADDAWRVVRLFVSTCFEASQQAQMGFFRALWLNLVNVPNSALKSFEEHSTLHRVQLCIFRQLLDSAFFAMHRPRGHSGQTDFDPMTCVVRLARQFTWPVPSESSTVPPCVRAHLRACRFLGPESFGSFLAHKDVLRWEPSVRAELIRTVVSSLHCWQSDLSESETSELLRRLLQLLHMDSAFLLSSIVLSLSDTVDICDSFVESDKYASDLPPVRLDMLTVLRVLYAYSHTSDEAYRQFLQFAAAFLYDVFHKASDPSARAECEKFLMLTVAFNSDSRQCSAQWNSRCGLLPMLQGDNIARWAAAALRSKTLSEDPNSLVSGVVVAWTLLLLQRDLCAESPQLCDELESALQILRSDRSNADDGDLEKRQARAALLRALQKQQHTLFEVHAAASDVELLQLDADMVSVVRSFFFSDGMRDMPQRILERILQN